MIVALWGCLCFVIRGSAGVFASAYIERQGDLAAEGFLANDCVDLIHEIKVLAQVILGVLTSLTDADITVGEEGAAFGNDFELGGEVEDITGFGDAFVEHDIELGSAEGRRDFILNHLDAGAIADDFVANFDGLNAAHIETDRGIELECLTTGGGFRVAEHDADLLAELIGEDDSGFGLVDRAGKFAQRLRHKAGLHTHG